MEREPTMREVLDSIRRIIGDEDGDNGARTDAEAALALLKAPYSPHLWPLTLWSGAIISTEWGDA